MKRNSKLLNKVTVVFICAAIMLIFFSTTIYNFNLPKVTVGFPEQNEFIINSVKGIGEVKLLSKDTYFTDIEGILECNAKVGDYFIEGQVIYRVIPQNDETSNELARLQNELVGLDYRIDKVNSDIAYYKQKLQSAKPDPAYIGPLDLTSYDTQIDIVLFKIESMREELISTDELHQLGIVSGNQVTQLKNELKSLELEYDKLIKQKENAIADDERKREQNNKNALEQFENLLDTYNKSIIDLEYQLKSLNIEKNNVALRIEDIDYPDTSDQTTLEFRARSDCVIESLSTDNGAFVNKYNKILTVGVVNTDVVVMMKMSEDVNYIMPEMIVNVDIRAKRLYGIQGQVYSVKRDTGELIVEVRIPPAPPNPPPLKIPKIKDTLRGIILYGGETAEMKIENESGLMEYVVPNSAVFRDSAGYFVYSVVRKASAFGYDYIAEKKYVNVAMRSEHYSALSPIGFVFEDPLVINSDGVINDGDRVMLADGVDYIGTR